MAEVKKTNPHEEGEPFFPHHVLEQTMMVFIAMAVLLALVMFFPAPMEPPADPFETPEHIKPEWYFLAAYQSLKVAEFTSFLGPWAPKLMGILAQGVGMMFLVLLPFLDRGPERRWRKRPVVIGIGVLTIISLVVLTLWGKYS